MATTKKRKVISAVTAVVVAAVICATGTFAWQSISQTALNETAGGSNPGARLHDDFDGRNKDVYVENFTDPDGGTAIFARIRLSEYMEVGAGAGLKPGDIGYDSKITESLGEAKLEDTSTWIIHKPGETAENLDNLFHRYWSWDMGGQTVYMPTFNMNKDSLAADINGTYEGTNPDDNSHYDDYHAYTDGEEKTGTEIWDKDNNDVDEEEPVEGVNISSFADKTHTAKATQDATVLTMAQWMAMGSPVGKYWVYDTDGWAYWAEAIMPGEATGLLLNGINLEHDPDGQWYYAIEVTAQFATRNDWGESDGTGFYDVTQGAVPTETALLLLNKAAEVSKARAAIKNITPGSTTTVTIDEIEFYVLAKQGDQALLLSKNILEERAFDDNDNRWKDSEIRNYLNNEWLSGKSTLSQYAVMTALYTIQEYNSTDMDVTEDKVFLLSEADLFETSGVVDVQPSHYTAGSRLSAPGGSWIVQYNGQNNWWWLRSPGSGTYSVAVVNDDGYAGTLYNNTGHGVRPALWVDLGS